MKKNKVNIYNVCNWSRKRVETLAKKLGLTQLDFLNTYNVTKTWDKLCDSADGGGLAIGNAHIHLMAVTSKKKHYMWIVCLNGWDWFKTSPILSCTKNDDETFKIETENSFYELTPLKSKLEIAIERLENNEKE